MYGRSSLPSTKLMFHLLRVTRCLQLRNRWRQPETGGCLLLGNYQIVPTNLLFLAVVMMSFLVLVLLYQLLEVTL